MGSPYVERTASEEDSFEREELMFLAMQLNCTMKDLENSITHGEPIKDLNPLI